MTQKEVPVEFGNEIIRLLVGETDCTHSLFGKNTKMKLCGGNIPWDAAQMYALFDAVKQLPGGSGNLHGCQISVLDAQQADQLNLGDQLLQITGEYQVNSRALRKNVVEITGREPGSEILIVEKRWPRSVDWRYETRVSTSEIAAPPRIKVNNPLPVLHFSFAITNPDCYDYKGHQKFDKAAARASDFMALSSCFMLCLEPAKKARVFSGEVAWLTHRSLHPYCRNVYYLLRRLLMDRTMEDLVVVLDWREDPPVDKIALHMRDMQIHILQELNEGPSNPRSIQIAQALVSQAAADIPVAMRLRTMLYPWYDPSGMPNHLLEKLWIAFQMLARELRNNGDGKTILRSMFRQNLASLRKHYRTLTTQSLEQFFS